MSSSREVPIQVTARMISMLSEFQRPDSIMSRARVIVVEYLAGRRPSDPRHYDLARGIVATMQQVARANGYERLQDVDETSVSHALNLQIALEVTNIRVSDPPVARYLQQRVAEHLTYEEEEEDDEVPHASPFYVIAPVVGVGGVRARLRSRSRTRSLGCPNSSLG